MQHSYLEDLLPIDLGIQNSRHTLFTRLAKTKYTTTDIDSEIFLLNVSQKDSTAELRLPLYSARRGEAVLEVVDRG